jgi:hypothetical protein
VRPYIQSMRMGRGDTLRPYVSIFLLRNNERISIKFSVEGFTKTSFRTGLILVGLLSKITLTLHEYRIKF